MFKPAEKIYLNPDNLALTPRKQSIKSRIVASTFFIFSAIFLGIIGFILSSWVYNTPADKKLQDQNRLLQENYQVLDRKVLQLSEILQKLAQTDDSIYRAVLGADPLPPPVRNAGKGGSSDIRYSGEDYQKLVGNTALKIEKLLAQTTIQKRSYEDVLLLAKKNNSRMLHLPAIMPIHNKDLTRTGSGFGMRMHPILKYRRMHYGIDFNTPKGTPVYATACGKISLVKRSTTFGRFIIIDHGYGYSTYYGHLSAYNVEKGRKVNRGDIIGFVGSTGLSSGNHLHYEVHLNGKAIDPVNYFYKDLSPEEYDKIVELSKTNLYSMD